MVLPVLVGRGKEVGKEAKMSKNPPIIKLCKQPAHKHFDKGEEINSLRQNNKIIHLIQ